MTSRNGATVMSCSESISATFIATKSYRPHCRKNAISAPRKPRMKPSTTNGIRMNEFVAPTIFMIAISSLREYMASLTVFEMISSDTTNSTAMITADAMFSTFCTVWKPLMISYGAFTSDTPSTARICASVSFIRLLSSSVTT